MEPRRAVKNVTNAKANAMKSDSTWGIRRAVVGIQRVIIEAIGNTRDFGSLFLYHTWVIFVIVRNASNKIWGLTHNCCENTGNQKGSGHPGREVVPFQSILVYNT